MYHKVKRSCFVLLIIFSCLSQVSFANTQQNNVDIEDEFEIQENQKIDIQDPFEKLNREVFKFNIWMIESVTYPVFSNYQKYVPVPIRWSIKNFGENFTITPFDITYSVLDFDIEAATVAFWRLLLNSTIGFFGIVDIANDFNLPSYGKNFAQVMHFYGVPDGPYMMIPVLGPRTNRGSFGMLVDTLIGSPLLIQTFGIPTIFIAQTYSGFLNPFYRFGLINSLEIVYEIPNQLYNINLAENATDVLHQIKTSGVDLYQWSKTGYMQYYQRYIDRYDENRKYKIMRNRNICDNDWDLKINDNINNNLCEADSKEYKLTFSNDDDFFN